MSDPLNPSIPRREFLALASLAGAATLSRANGVPEPIASRAGTDSGPATVPVKLGIASYSLREFPRDRAIAMIKELGTPFVNIKSVHMPYELTRDELLAARHEIEAAGLRIVGGGTITFGTDTDDDVPNAKGGLEYGVRHYFEYAKAAGMPLIVGTCRPAILPRIERFAQTYDIAVAIHNHGPEDEYYPSPYDVLRHVNGLDPRVGLCMDIGHTARAGTDIVKAAADAGPRLLDIHAKDLRSPSAAGSQCIVGEGVLPIPQLFRQLEKMGYAGYVNLEYEIDPANPLPGMKQSLAYMRGVLAGAHAAEHR